MDSMFKELTASDRNTGTGRIELSSQGSSGQDVPFGVSNQVTDMVLFNCDFESSIIRYFLLLLCYLLFFSFFFIR